MGTTYSILDDARKLLRAHGFGALAKKLTQAKKGVPNVPLYEAPLPMMLYCPRCGLQHIDKPAPEKGWDNPPHRSHECQGCGCVWRPADVTTTGVAAVQSRGHADTWVPGSPSPKDEFNAAINFTLDTNGGLDFLELWREGSWPEIEAQFPEFKKP